MTTPAAAQQPSNRPRAALAPRQGNAGPLGTLPAKERQGASYGPATGKAKCLLRTLQQPHTLSASACSTTPQACTPPRARNNEQTSASAPTLHSQTVTTGSASATSTHPRTVAPHRPAPSSARTQQPHNAGWANQLARVQTAQQSRANQVPALVRLVMAVWLRRSFTVHSEGLFRWGVGSEMGQRGRGRGDHMHGIFCCKPIECIEFFAAFPTTRELPTRAKTLQRIIAPQAQLPPVGVLTLSFTN